MSGEPAAGFKGMAFLHTFHTASIPPVLISIRKYNMHACRGQHVPNCVVYNLNHSLHPQAMHKASWKYHKFCADALKTPYEKCLFNPFHTFGFQPEGKKADLLWRSALICFETICDEGLVGYGFPTLRSSIIPQRMPWRALSQSSSLRAARPRLG